jgi:hypothetical protein
LGGTTSNGGRTDGGTVAAGGTGRGGAFALGGTVAAGGTTATTTSSATGVPYPVKLERGGNFGACVDQGQFRDAIIRPDDAGALMLTGSIHHSPDSSSSQADPFGPIALTSDQIVHFQALVAALPPDPCPVVSSPCDTCWGTTITIDSKRYVDNMCQRCDYSLTVNLLGEFFDSLASQGSATPDLDGGIDLAEAGNPDRAPSLDAGGPDLDRNASWDASLARLDVSRSFPELFEGIWLFGWSGGSNHFSWIRFSALSADPASPGTGTVDILAGKDAVVSNLGFWPCDGQGHWFITQRPDTISIELPPACPPTSDQTYTITAIQDGPGTFLRPGSAQRIALSGGSLAPVEAFRYPDSQCDAAMTACTPVDPVRKFDAAAM